MPTICWGSLSYKWKLAVDLELSPWLLKRKYNKNSFITLVIRLLYKDLPLDVILSSALCVSFWGQSSEVFYVQHEIWDRKSGEIRFQYTGVLDGFHSCSLTPKPNSKHLLHVWSGGGSKSLSFFFFFNELHFIYAPSPGGPRTLAVSWLDRQCEYVVKGTVSGHRMPGFKPQLCHSLTWTLSCPLCLVSPSIRWDDYDNPPEGLLHGLNVLA